MSTLIELRVTQTVEEGPLYRVNMEVLHASDISPDIFVFEVACDDYSHVATPFDLEHVPTTPEVAENDGINYYRQRTVTKDFDTVDAAREFSTYTRGRVGYLVREYPKVVGDFEGTHDYTYED